MLIARGSWVICWLACLALIGANCSGRQIDPRIDLGYVTIAGEPAVYAPVCPADEVSAIKIYEVPEPITDKDLVLLWQASGAADQSTKDGLIVLGKGFEKVEKEPPAVFPATLSIQVKTVQDRPIKEAHERPAVLPDYPAGTPASQMTFETSKGRKTFDELRKPLGCADK